MSRIAKQPIVIPPGVTVTVEGRTVRIGGAKGEVSLSLHPWVKLDLKNDKTLLLQSTTSMTDAQAMTGAFRAIIANHVYGVNQGWSKILELVGVGYRASVAGNELILTIGYSHPVKIKAPTDIVFSVSENKITVSGIDRQLVGEVAARIRRFRPPEPYKGKGIRYVGEVIRKKAGKAAKAVGGATGGA